MIKTLLFLGAISMGLTSISQTITATTVANVGDTIINATDNAPSINIGTAGTGNNWNFSSLLANSKDTIVFIPMSQVPNGTTNFPSATYGTLQDTAFIILEKQPTQLELVGVTNGILTVKHRNPETIITFPSSFGTSFSDNSRIVTTVSGADFGQPLADSIRVQSSTISTSNFDASGTLTTPFGVFSAIRQNLTRTTRDTIYAKGALTGGVYTQLLIQADTVTSHQYWSDAANAKFALVTYDLNAAGALAGSVEWYYDYSANPSIGIAEQTIKTISVYPNPANNQLTIDNHEAINNLTISDLTGKLVFSSNQITNNTLSIDFLNKGMYILTISTDSYTGTARFVKQ